MKGICTAMVTPFLENGEIDKAAFIALLEQQERAGIETILLAGTTGEGWSLEESEVGVLYALARKYYRGDIVIASGAMSTKETVKRTKFARNLGADACLVIMPFYNLPCQEGLIDHFEEVASIGLDVIAYHHPKRTGLTVSVEGLEKILQIDGVVGLKETFYEEEITRLADYGKIYAGNDDKMNYMQEKGACGVISVISNLFPILTKDFFASKLNDKESEFFTVLKKILGKGNPVGIKGALSIKNNRNFFVRKPLKALGEHGIEEIRKILCVLKCKEIANI